MKCKLLKNRTLIYSILIIRQMECMIEYLLAVHLHCSVPPIYTHTPLLRHVHITGLVFDATSNSEIYD